MRAKICSSHALLQPPESPVQPYLSRCYRVHVRLSSLFAEFIEDLIYSVRVSLYRTGAFAISSVQSE
jgi:hypothetical protein